MGFTRRSVLGLSAAIRPAGEELSQNVGTLTTKRTSTVGFGVTTETLEAIHFQVMTSNVSVIHAKSSPPNSITYWTEQRCNQQCGSPGAGFFSSDWWKGVWCGFSCTGACPIRAAAFAAGREHTFPIEQCAEHCYCVFKGWTA